MSGDKSLVGLMSEIMALEFELLETNGELSPEMEARWQITADNAADKVDSYFYVLEALNARAEYFRGIEKNACAARRVFETQERRLKENIRFAMQVGQTSELLGADYRYKLTPMKPKLALDEALLPEAYKKDTIVKVPNRDLIETDLLLGMNIPGAEIKEVEALRCYMNPGAKKAKKDGAQ